MASFTNSEHLTSYGLNRRRWLRQTAAALASFSLSWPLPSWSNPFKSRFDYMAAMPHLPVLKDPLLVLRDFQSDSDMEIKHRIYSDIAEDNDLIQQIKQKIGFDQKVTMTIEDLTIRLLYVPELRKDYSVSYENYCHSVIEHILTKTRSENIFGQILNPVTSFPTVVNGGISAFLVHQLGKEYQAKCCFSAKNGRTACYQLNGACFSNFLGAVEVIITCPAKDDFQIQRSNVTVWQNRSDNLYSLLQIPAEETFHYILGPYTDIKIKEELRRKQLNTVAEVQQLANYWLAIEEAIVGGLVDLFLKEYTAKYGPTVAREDVTRCHAAKKDTPKYRYRQTGIGVVAKMGFQPAFELYRSDPTKFQRQLLT